MKKYVLFCRYCRYCVIYWKHHGFSFKTGGFLVTHRNRIRESRKSKNEGEKYAKEHFMCQILKRHGFQVEHLPDNKLEGTYDITLNGIPTDLKRMHTHTNIQKKAKHSINEQGAKFIVFQFDNWNGKFRAEIEGIKKKGIHGYYFLTSDVTVIHSF